MAADALAFDERHVSGASGGERKAEQPDACIEVDDTSAAGEGGDLLDEGLQQVPVPLEECARVALEHQRRLARGAAHTDAVGDERWCRECAKRRAVRTRLELEVARTLGGGNVLGNLDRGETGQAPRRDLRLRVADPVDRGRQELTRGRRVAELMA